MEIEMEMHQVLPKDGEKRKESSTVSGTSHVRTYKPPKLKVLQVKNRLKSRRFNTKKKKFNKFVLFAPWDKASLPIRAKKVGGIASLISLCLVTPAVLPTPVFSPEREGLIEMANEEWGVNGYTSMNDLICLRSTEADTEPKDDDSSNESDVEDHVEVECRLNHDFDSF
eukprot:Gb_13738 [translate_table: standard]